MLHIKAGLIVCLLLSLPIEALCAPSITSVTGTLTNGQSITISGSGFGTKTAAPLISSYDNTTSGNNWHGTSAGNYPGGSWNNNEGPTLVQTAAPRTSLYQSDHYLKCDFTYGDTPYGRIGYDVSGTSNVYYMSFWYYLTPATWNFVDGMNSKFWRFYLSGGAPAISSSFLSVNDHSGYPAVNYLYAGQDGFSGSTEDYNDAYIPGTILQNWNHVEVYTLVSSNTTNYTFVDGKPRAWTGIGNPDSHTDDWWVWGHVSGTAYAGVSILIDEVYLDNTPQHVFISNKSDISNWLTYNATAHNEIQVPSAWATGEITITLNTGTFTNHTTDGRYLYVVDSSGAISNAYDLAGDPPADTTAPAVTADDSTKSIGSDSYSAEGDATDAVGVSGCKWRIGSAPDSGNGTGCTGTTAWTCSTSGYSSGEQTLYIGCYDAAGNYGTDTVTVTYTPTSTVTSMTGGLISGGTFYR